MELGLTGRRALVTGASRGLGRACAQALATDGAQVVICSRDEEALGATASEMGAAGWIAADVSRREDVRRAVAEATATLGGLDILVTNAGGPPTGSFEQATDEEWALAHQLTLMSSVRLIREAVAPLKASGRGRIVNLTGFGVKEPMTDLLVSDSARAAVTVMAKTIATDFAPFGITVNNIAAGPILTDRLYEWHSARAKKAGITVDEQLERFAKTIPVRRVGQPDEVGNLCAYLCSAHAGFITGQSIVIDGGINRSI
jgi:3-oxoacyl-[acyl-carrier protein] reductase